MVVLRVLPEAGIYAVRRFFIIVQERIGLLTPEDRPILVLQFQSLRRVDQSAGGEFIFLLIIEVKFIVDGSICLCRKVCGGLDLGGQTQVCLFRAGSLCPSCAQPTQDSISTDARSIAAISFIAILSPFPYCSRITGGCQLSSAAISGT